MESSKDTNKKANYTAKILMLGDSSVGKSSLITRFCENNFSETMTTTVGIDYKLKKVKIEGVDLKLQIWDTAGQEKYRALAQSYYKNSMGILLVFDMSDEQTYENVRNWVRQIKNNAGDNICKLLIANKADLDRKVSLENIKELASDIGMEYFECSAKSGQNVDEAFMHLAKEIKKKFFPNATPGDLNASAIKPQGTQLKNPTKEEDGESAVSKTDCKC